MVSRGDDETMSDEEQPRELEHCVAYRIGGVLAGVAPPRDLVGTALAARVRRATGAATPPPQQHGGGRSLLWDEDWVPVFGRAAAVFDAAGAV